MEAELQSVMQKVESKAEKLMRRLGAVVISLVRQLNFLEVDFLGADNPGLTQARRISWKAIQ
jgi:hypothetical protein